MFNTYFTVASICNLKTEVTLTERKDEDGSEFVIEAIDLDADYRDNVWSFDVTEDRQEAWAIYEWAKERFL